MDSEIACLSRNSLKISGAVTNSYFRSTDAGGNPNCLLVSRIDGPDYNNAKRLIDDAIAVENSGLWGNALIDIANLAEAKGAAYKTGDKWLENCGEFYKRAGIPVIYDRFSSLIPGAYPLGEDIILYFGWYSQNAQGPFADSKFKFKKGAIAAHIHSYSASTIRTTLKHWSGPLVARGACAVLGNVYEPFLQMTTHLDIFNARLLAGFTFAESAWIATPVLSWMQVMIGDPLYQPFKSNIKITEGTDDGYKAFKVAVLKNQLDLLSDSIKDPSLMESIGLHLMIDKDYQGAEKSFNGAFKNYDSLNDKLRIKIHLANSKRNQGKRKEAIKILRELRSSFKEEPAAEAINNLMKTATQRDLMVKISNETGMTQQQVFDVIQKTLDTITQTLAAGDEVVLRNFGSFQVKETKQKIGRNPNKPGTDVVIPPRAIVKFKPGKEMKERVANVLPQIQNQGESTPPITEAAPSQV